MPATLPRPPPLDLLVVGHTNVDMELRVPRLPRGDETVPVLSRRTSLGGTAANIARWSARLGRRVGLASFVGFDLPPTFLPRLRKDGVGTADVRVRPGQFSPVCWIFEDGRGGQMTVIDQGAMGATAEEPLPIRSIQKCRIVHATTGDPAYQLRLAEAAREAGRLVACDPAQEVHYRWNRKDLARMLRSSEILFGNEAEIARACRILRASSPTALLASVPLVVMTQGARGARAYSRAGTVKVPPARVQHFHRVTGAGDAFRAGFYQGWFTGGPLEDCLAWGAATGAAAVEFPQGPNGELPSAAKVAAKLRGKSRSRGGPR